MFAKLGLAEPILRAVAAEGYTTPTPIQSKTIPELLSGRDLLGCAQTGTGKTAAFALPILHRLAKNPRPDGRTMTNTQRLARPIRVLVLAPTRELAVQIGDSFKAYGCFAGLRHTVIYGGVAQGPQTRALRDGIDILIATPGRLLDLMGQQFIDFSGIETFVLDEADRMLDMGFMPDVRRIMARLPSSRQTVLFCATMPEPIQRLADAILRDPVRVRIAPIAETTELIEESVFFVPRRGSRACWPNCSRRRISSGPWFSRGPSTERTRSSNNCGAPASAPTPSTATRAKTPASGRLTTSRKTATRSSWPPTSPPGASTWTASPTCSTTTCRTSRKPTSTASAAPAAPGPRAWPSRSATTVSGAS